MIPILKDQRGAAAIYVAIFIAFIGIGVAAFAIDYGYRHVAQNELQDAADAGALAGARALYWGDGKGINSYDGSDPSGEFAQSANTIARNTALANISAGTPVEIYNWSANTGAANEDVQRGHWSFGYGSLPRGFYCDSDNYNVTDPVAIGGYNTIQLDEMKTFINAVKVVTRRQATPVSTFFGKIFGVESFELYAESVAWLGYTGSLDIGEADIPIAVCLQSIWVDLPCEEGGEPNGIYDACDRLDCSYGRMLNSGTNQNDHNTAGWTNFSLDCDTANPTSMRPLLATCDKANPKEINYGDFIGTTGGVDDSIIGHPTQDSLVNCWRNATYDETPDDNAEGPYLPLDDPTDPYEDHPVHPWNVTLPIINCEGNNVANCSEVVGAVNVNIVWILEKENAIDDDAPYKMGNWGPQAGCTSTNCYDSPDGTGKDVDGTTRWDSFVNYYGLRMVDGELSTVANDGFKKKSVYFMPDCNKHKLAGDSNGTNTGMMAKEPKIVNIPKSDPIFNN